MSTFAVADWVEPDAGRAKRRSGMAGAEVAPDRLDRAKCRRNGIAGAEVAPDRLDRAKCRRNGIAGAEVAPDRRAKQVPTKRYSWRGGRAGPQGQASADETV